MNLGQRLGPADRVQAPGFNNRLPVGGFDFFRANVRRGDRVYVLARPGTTVRGVDFPTGARTFARYYLLPAIVVERPEDATVVVGMPSSVRNQPVKRPSSSPPTCVRPIA